MNRMLRLVPPAVVGVLLVTLFFAPVRGDEPPATNVKVEHFDRDPGWEGYRNHVEPKKPAVVQQDFGYSPTSYVGAGIGEVGGKITRANRPAYYADKIGKKTLDEKLTASGTFAFTKTSPAAGIFFGWFNHEQPGGGGRPMSSLGLHFDCEHSGARLAVRLITGTNQSCGTFITPFIPGKFRPTPIRNDGTHYTWTLNYDPDGANGRGQFRFTIKSDRSEHEAFEGKEFVVDLPEGYRQSGAVFDCFGLMNMMKSGGTATIHFGGLRYDGKTPDLSRDPGWAASGNRVTYEDRERVGAHDFGYSKTSFAGGALGEVGGSLWRSGDYGYYADRVGPLSLADRLEASGKVTLVVGAPDSDMFLGWFSSKLKDESPPEKGHFLGVHVGGPTRIGHYFQPAFATAKGTRGHADKGPVLTPGKVYDWSLLYDPSGLGSIRVTLGKESVTLALKQGIKAQGAEFDRFGLCTSTIGGQLVKIYLDDLRYTTSAGKR